MLKGRDVVIISSVEWDSLWQGAQEMITTSLPLSMFIPERTIRRFAED